MGIFSWLRQILHSMFVPKGAPEHHAPPSRPPSMFQLNIESLARNIRDTTVDQRVVVIGRPGAGKSAIVRTITSNDSFPRPHVGVETDATNWNVVEMTGGVSLFRNRLFVDTPGYGTDIHPTSVFLSHFPFDQFGVVLLVISGKITADDESVFAHIAALRQRKDRPLICVIRGRADEVTDADRSVIANDLNCRLGGVGQDLELIFFSAVTSEGTDAVRERIGITKLDGTVI